MTKDQAIAMAFGILLPQCQGVFFPDQTYATNIAEMLTLLTTDGTVYVVNTYSANKYIVVPQT